MYLIHPSFKIISIQQQNGFSSPIELIERCGRICYKSEDKITANSSTRFCSNLLKLGHESVIEHSSMTVIFIVDRGVSHELVRHRLCAISQESTRYCNYSGSVTFVIPPWIKLPEGKFLHDDIEKLLSTPDKLWAIGMIDAEWRYKKLLNQGWSPQQARSVLPNSLKTELAVTANFREWRHIIKLRTSKAAHPQMREIMLPFLEECKALLPVIFDNIGV